MTANILEASRITKRFDGFAALTNVDFALLKGERVGLIGPNGSGKSTFVNCLTGILAPDEGSITFDAHEITKTPAWLRAKRGLARTYQNSAPVPWNDRSREYRGAAAFRRWPHVQAHDH